jgi:hypothetical protein
MGALYRHGNFGDQGLSVQFFGKVVQMSLSVCLPFFGCVGCVATAPWLVRSYWCKTEFLQYVYLCIMQSRCW